MDRWPYKQFRETEGNRGWFRARRQLLLALLLDAAARIEPSRPAPTPEQPNLLFILADDLLWDSLGRYCNQVVRTPNQVGDSDEVRRRHPRDPEADPCEQMNLADSGDHGALIDDLHALLLRWRQRAPYRACRN